MRRIAVVLPLVLTFGLSMMAAYALPEVAWTLANPASADTDPTFLFAGFIGLAIMSLALHVWGAVWLLRGPSAHD
ncbi:hypothetical protein GRS96_01225 [Rathayibacter sp. VKM Ac-2803]|uniref:hypothetical protein n=1 Tax=unclassified Rathayibacter TaxID=2609250 RepID=UPI00135887D4|nr:MULTISPECIES: hypothetical protein [unclassified Rathayibacter]MWV47892.1 hypothetical protein [Rathayibacter sp. VKM Ac-2803]MWV58893.1 hypothetical protein [Rathayibacter sp. VKM Ac-2754]